VSDAGDVNNDGYADVVVGAYFDDKNALINNGSAQVFSGSISAFLFMFIGFAV